ncbi:MAG: polysaccharide deacetylase family protein, partial [Planctomycetota bacterium]|nr:polysaccharide deacetylase family protein [Planctomycetota bacterium]
LEAEGDRERDKPLICVTFDDGYRDNAEIVAPILATHGLKATFFLATGLIGTDQRFWFDRAAQAYQRLGNEGIQEKARHSGGTLSEWMMHLKSISSDRRESLLDDLESDSESVEATLMTWNQARALCEQGHELGSHTMSHPLLPQLDDLSLQRELSVSKSLLEDKLGQDIPGFCYPNGDHDERVIDAVKTAGYEWACTTKAGRHDSGRDPYRMTRLDITPQRVLHESQEHDELGFRSEISLLREHFRTKGQSAS